MLGVTTRSVLCHADLIPRAYDVIIAHLAFAYGCGWYFTSPAERRSWLVAGPCTRHDRVPYGS